LFGERQPGEFLPNGKIYEQILEQFGLYVYPRPHVTNSELARHPQVR